MDKPENLVVEPMQSNLTCASCGAVLPTDAPEGNCPACLLQLAWANDPGAAQEALLTEFPQTIRYFGDYELQSEIARGGMGVVYRARQVSLNRPVALKMILGGRPAGKNQLQRFRLEAEAAARLDHPNIVPIFEIGEHEGQHFYSMKLVEGANLAQKLAQSKMLEPRAAAALIATIARAVHYAHQHGILHRDLKPTNILLGPKEEPYVTDFGLAKILADDSDITRTLAVMGTPAYMAPEQAAGHARQLTTAADVFSLGAILYEFLTGRPPFVAASALETIRLVCEQEPIPPTQLLRRLEPPCAGFAKSKVKSQKSKIPADLETICLKCLRKEPTSRYGSAQALADDLERWLAHEPILARRTSAPEKLIRWARRNPKTALLSSAVLLLLITVAVGSTLAVFRIKRAQDLATEKLFDSYLAQARALRRSGREGQRFDSLAAIGKAAAIHASPELRSETIAALALTDMSFSHPQRVPNPEEEVWARSLELRAWGEPDGSVKVIRVADGAEVVRLPDIGTGHGAVQRFSQQQRLLAVWYSSGRGVVWNIETRRIVLDHIPNPMGMDFTPDEQGIVVSCLDSRLRRFDLNGPSELPSFQLTRRYHLLALNPQFGFFAASENERSDLEVRSLRDGSLFRKFSAPAHVGSFAWSNDGLQLAVGGENGHVYIWNPFTGETEQEFGGHQDSVTSVGFSRSGRLLASSGWDGCFCLRDLMAGYDLISDAGYGFQLSFSSDDRQIAYILRGSENGSLELTPSSIFRSLNCRTDSNRGAWSVDVSPDGRLMAAALSDGVRIWADDQKEEPFFLPESCQSVVFTPDGRSLITCGKNGITCWPMLHLQGGNIETVRFGPPRPIRQGLVLAYGTLSADGRWVAAANNRAGAVAIYELENPTNRFALVSQPGCAFPAISPDLRLLASGTWKGSGIKIWDFQTRRLLRELPTPYSAWVSFSPDGHWLAVAGTTYDVWDTSCWQRRYSYPRVRSELAETPLAFSPDSRMLAIAREPNVVQLLFTATGETAANLEAPQAGNIAVLRYSPDGAKLFALEWDKKIQVWDLREIRSELRKLNLDWSSPPLPPPRAVGNKACVLALQK